MPSKAKAKPKPDPEALRIRAMALDLAIKAAPYLIPTAHDRIRGSQLTAEAENIEAWLKGATL